MKLIVLERRRNDKRLLVVGEALRGEVKARYSMVLDNREGASEFITIRSRLRALENQLQVIPNHAAPAIGGRCIRIQEAPGNGRIRI